MSTKAPLSREALRARGILAARHRDHGADHPLTRAADRDYRSEATSLASALRSLTHPD